MKAEVRISDAQLGKIAKGQKAHIKLDAFPDSIFDGVVLNVEPSADVASGTFKVVVAIPNAKKLLKKGFYARVNIVTESRDSALSVPQDAIVADTLVFVANGDKAQARRIKIAFENTNEAVVDSGISAGESVIYEGVIGLFDGAPIKIEN
jgi:RND family efflux transporter MFP subunit